jgi:alkanesulfonate monooxygenase SsuD/methylene tetrahydromethanopterin reductase-like flavin-dependent oxidoreductase (luciferase family)
MSGGRVELGLGTAWYDAEHDSYGIPFYDTSARFAMLEEQLEILTGLWATPVGETYSFSGTHHELKDSPALPKPVQQPRPPIIVGGHGPKRTPRLVAQFADEYNMPFGRIEDFVQQKERVEAACEAIGRDPAKVTFSSALTVCCAEDEAGLERRAEAIGQPLEQLRLSGLAGTPTELVDTLGRWADAGSTRTYLQVLDVTDLDQVRLIASSVLAAVADL